MASTKRILKELQGLTDEPVQGVTIESDEKNIYQWTGVIQGPVRMQSNVKIWQELTEFKRDCVYRNGHFKISVTFPANYPFKSPLIKFTTRIYHPNIDDDGSICLGMLKEQAWKPATRVADILRALVQLLREPNPDDPLVASIAEQFKTDRKAFDKRAAEAVQKFALKP